MYVYHTIDLSQVAVELIPAEARSLGMAVVATANGIFGFARDQLYKIGLPGKLILGDYFQ